MRAIGLGIASALVFIGSALSQETPRSAESLECSKQADALGLHGAERLAFRSQCKANPSGPTSQTASAPSSPIATIVFPKGISPIYSQEPEGKARMHTCVDQYNANKASNANGAMKWIEPGGGYYSVCNERLKTVTSSPPPMARAPINPSVAENPKVAIGGSLTMQECAAKYQAAKAAGMLNGRRWNDFRREECNAEATAGGSRSEPNNSSLAAPHAADGKQGRLGLSFDCAIVKSASARLICSDQELTDATQQLGFVYANAKDHGGDPDGTTKAQLAWIKERNKRCGLDNKSNVPVEELVFAKPCMLEAINRRISVFGGSVPASAAEAALPAVPSPETSQPLSQEEVDAFRKFMGSWNPALGTPSLDVHFRLKRDGTIDGAPEILSTGTGPLFEAAKNDALRMIQQGQPFKMFRPESYEAWKDMIITFEASSAQVNQPRN